MTDRIPCEVPFCRRTASKAKFPEPDTRIICGKHWRTADQRPRRAYSLAMRRVRKNLDDERAKVIANNCWERVRKQAIERAAGVR